MTERKGFMGHESISQADGYAGDQIPPSLVFNKDAFVLAMEPSEVMRIRCFTDEERNNVFFKTAGVIGEDQHGNLIYLPLPEDEEDGV